MGSRPGEPRDFALMLGGPTYEIWKKTGLCGSALQLLGRRIVVLATLAWVPLLVLSSLEGHARAGSIELAFLHDVELHVRLLVALPLLLAAEWPLQLRLISVGRYFVARELIPATAHGRLDAAVASAMRLRDSTLAEILLLALVYVVGVGFVWRTHVALDVASWHDASSDGGRLSLAGWWLALVSLPLFQFLLLRWYWRLFVWARFLWQVSRIELRIISTHPDRCGGLGFLSSLSNGFVPLLLAQGSVLAGLIAGRILHAGATLPEFRLELIGLVAVMVFAILGPLLAFAPQLVAARYAGSAAYGALAHRYVRDFDDKWVRDAVAPDEQLLGSADVQSLADMGNSYAVVKEMRVVPFTARSVLHLGVATLVPVAPLLLTVLPLEDLLVRLLHVVF